MSDVLHLLRKRRSIRAYTGEPVPGAHLEKILQAGLLAPSSRALFPVEFIVVRNKAMLHQLARAKTAGSGMLKGADVAIVVMGDTERSDAWIEDCSLAMIYMQLEATELGVGSCWVQCRGRVSQQKRNEPIAPTSGNSTPTDAGGQDKGEAAVAATIANDAQLTDHMDTDEFLRELLDIPQRYSVEAILSLGMPARDMEAHELPALDTGKVHYERYL